MLSSVSGEFHRYNRLLQRAVDQVSDEQFFLPLADGQNSIAILVKHLGGNLASRFTDFLTSDGEKSWRNRDQEFVVKESRADIMDVWHRGFSVLEAQLNLLTDEDMNREITIRGQTLTVSDALCRSLAHVSYHIGEIVQLCRYHAGTSWQYLSIPPNKSEEYNANPTLEKPAT